MKKQRHEIGIIIAWANDGEVATYNSLQVAADCAEVNIEALVGALGTDTEIGGVTYFRYGIDKESTKGYDDAWTEVEKDRAKEEEEEENMKIGRKAMTNIEQIEKDIYKYTLGKERVECAYIKECNYSKEKGYCIECIYYKASLKELATALDKKGYRKQEDVAREIFEMLRAECEKLQEHYEETKNNLAWDSTEILIEYIKQTAEQYGKEE